MEIDQPLGNPRDREYQDMFQTENEKQKEKNTTLKIKTKYQPNPNIDNPEIKLIDEDDSDFPTTIKLSQGTPTNTNPGENDWYTIQKGKAVPLQPKNQKVSLKDKATKTTFQKNQPPAAINTIPQPQLQQKQTTTSPQTNNLPKPKPTYHLPPPPAKLYHRLGTQNKAKREVKDGQLFYTTTVKYVVYIRAEQPEKPSILQLL